MEKYKNIRKLKCVEIPPPKKEFLWRFVCFVKPTGVLLQIKIN